MRPAARAMVVAGLIALYGLTAVTPAPAHARSLPSGFYDETVFEHLQDPTAIRFAPGGRVFVADKQGLIYVFDSLEDPTPTVFADLRKQVYDQGDRGILGLELDPNFEVNHHVYVLYTFNHVIGEQAPGAYPRWFDSEHPEQVAGDPCPKPEGADVDACPVSGRLVRLTAEGGGDHAEEEEVGGEEVAAEDVLVEDWCQQFSSHSIGDLQFGPEGALFASGGDGANFNDTDYGQFGWPQPNECGDPPGGFGNPLTPPAAEGGSLRAQNTENLDGSVIRIDPETGEGLPGNPFYGKEEGATQGTRENEARIIAYGFRNPFRFALDPESEEIYVGNVGWYTYEEIDRFPTDPNPAYNSGWPCYEGPGPTPGFSGLELDVCEALYDEPGSTSPPFFDYEHQEGVTPGDTCTTEYGSAIAGLDFYEGEVFPASYKGAFFFSDPVRRCIYVMFPGEDGKPDPSTTMPFLTDGGIYPALDIQEGPEGDLYYVKLFNEEYGRGEIHRIAYSSDNQPPVAHLTADHPWGETGEGKLEVEFDASGSTDPNGEELEFEWDLNYDGVFEDAPQEETATETYEDSENHVVAVRVVDEKGARSVARMTVYPGDTPPEPEILEPEESSPESGKADFEWHVGQPIHFEGAAQDNEDGELPPTSLEWNSRLHHCPFGPETCHVHPLQSFPELDSGTLIAPDHDYPSLIELTLTATDERGLAVSKTIDLLPHPVELTIDSEPSGVTLSAGELSEPAPYGLEAIEDSKVTLSAPATVQVGETTYAWTGWSDGGERTHTIEATAPATYTAEYSAPEAQLAAFQHWNSEGHLEAEFDASGSSGAPEPEYEWNLDGAGFEGSPSPDPTKTIPIEDEEPHTLAVRVIDVDGASDVTEETVSAVGLEIESQPVGIALTAGEVAKAAPFSLLALEGSTIQLSAPATVQVGETTYAWTGWSDGEERTHTIEATAPATYTAEYVAEEPPSGQPEETVVPQLPEQVLIEPPVLPRTVIDEHPGGKTHSATAKFAFSSSQSGAHFRCKLDKGKYRSCRSPWVHRHLKPGKHVFRVYAVNGSGETDPTPAKFRWKVLRRKR